MSRQPKTKSQSSFYKKYSFSEKEKQIIQEEISNKDALKTNIPIFQQLLLNRPELRSILFDPFRMIMIMQGVQQKRMADMSLSGRPPRQEELLEPIVQQLAPQIQPQALIAYLIPFMKQVKVKKEKRALLWAIGELLTATHDNAAPQNIPTIRAMILSSIQNAVGLSELAQNVIEGQEPFSFDYTRFLHGEAKAEEYQRIQDQLQLHEPHLSMAISVQAMDLFHFCPNPIGLRFPHVIHYPTIAGEVEQKRILMPGQAQPKENEDLSDDQLMSLSEVLMKDLENWSRSFDYRLGLMREFTQTAKSAASAEMDQTHFQNSLKAAAFCLLFARDWLPFFLRLYQMSGQHADRLNPDEEKSYIIDLKSSPDNQRIYRGYAEKLETKGDFHGALNLYKRLAELMEEPSEEVNTHISRLQEQLNA